MDGFVIMIPIHSAEKRPKRAKKCAEAAITKTKEIRRAMKNFISFSFLFCKFRFLSFKKSKLFLTKVNLKKKKMANKTLK